MSRRAASAGTRACPVCAAVATAGVFVEECIDRSRTDSLTYASRKTPEFMSHRLVRCADCGTVYAPDPPTEEILSRSYREAAFVSGREEAEAASAYWGALKPRLGERRGGAIEAGAGSGAFLPYLRRAGFDPVLGFEPSRAAIEAADAEVRPMLKEGVFTPAAAGRGFSLFCCFQTLEHVTSPKELIDGAFEVLAAEGMVAVIAHDYSAWPNRLLGRRSPIVDVEHLQLFCPNGLRVLLRRCGFVDVKVVSIRNAYNLSYWLRLLPLPAGLKSVLLRTAGVTRLGELVVGGRVGNVLATGRKTAPGGGGRASSAPPANKRNVSIFDRDAGEADGYGYARNESLSSRLSNARMTRGIADAADFKGKRVLDLGCGDGTFTADLAEMGAGSVLGLDPAARAIDLARRRNQSTRIEFRTGDIYGRDVSGEEVDVVVLRGVLHHLPDPARAVEIATGAGREIVVLEPNGMNPVLKMIERLSGYHREHEERSFPPATIDGWLSGAGAVVVHREFINLVPVFCPGWLARALKFMEPAVEAVPLLRVLACGQYVVRAIRK